MRIVEWPAAKLIKALRAKEVAKADVLDAYLKNSQPQWNAFITRMDAQALRIQADRPFDPSKPLDGVPMAIKDNLMTKGIETTCGDCMLKGFAPPYSATSCEKLEKAGALLIGKTNMDAFAMGSSSENPVFGSVRNPVDPTLTTGGSSGGSAAAVRACECAFALGSDTGGSARQPAAYCGVTAIKPTYGRVSRYGLNAFASSMDTVAPITRDVTDAALILDVISGRDMRDMTSVSAPPLGKLSGDVRGLRVALALNEADAPIQNAVLSAGKALERAGAAIKAIKGLFIHDALRAYAVLTAVEAMSNLARFDGLRDGLDRDAGFSLEVKRRIVMGARLAGGKLHERALQNRAAVQAAFEQLFGDYDALLCPVTGTMAFPLGALGDDPVRGFLCDQFTVPANLTGLPALALPFEGAAVQVYGPAFCEKALLNIGLCLERAGGAHAL